MRRWGKQLEGSKTQDRPEADELHQRLTARVPADAVRAPAPAGRV